MNIYTKSGKKVIFLGEEGYDHDKEKAKKYLEKGKEYSILRTVIKSFYTEVTLKEFPHIKFNSVLFKNKE